MKKSDIHILVVDDDEQIRDSLQQIIERAGYKVTTVGIPSEADNVIKLKIVHLALIDCMLPMINGVDLAKKLTNSSLKNAPVILMSGVFKDEQFAQDAIKKSGAVDFISKPFDVNHLLSRVGELISPLIDAKAGSLDSLLTKTEVNKREARKALDFLEDITGNDLMFALSVLMNSKSSGYVTVKDGKKNLIGFTLRDGCLIDVDTLKKSDDIKESLTGKGLLSKTEFEGIIEKANKKDPIGYMVEENLISPHMEKLIKVEKILKDLSYLFSQGSLDINFSENKGLEETKVSVNSQALDELFLTTISTKVPVQWLKQFYSEWTDKPIQLGSHFEGHPALAQISMFEDLKKLLEKIKKKASIKDLIESSSEEEAYVLVHYLVVSRLIYFANESKAKNLTEHESRLRKVLAKIEDKNPFEVFNHFGLGNNPPNSEVDRIYKEFAKSNHPDKLPKTASNDLVDLNNKVFSIVSDAHDTLVNEDKRRGMINKMKETEAKKQINAEQNLEKAMGLLNRGEYQEAYKLLDEAWSLYKDSKVLRLYHLWSCVKYSPEDVQNTLGEVRKELDEFSLEQKKSSLYYYVSGLLYTLEEDIENAEKSFTRSLEFDQNFLVSRRELMKLRTNQKSKGHKAKTADIFTGDLTTIVSGLFKKKSG